MEMEMGIIWMSYTHVKGRNMERRNTYTGEQVCRTLEDIRVGRRWLVVFGFLVLHRR
jgi:hypothetical protein